MDVFLTPMGQPGVLGESTDEESQADPAIETSLSMHKSLTDLFRVMIDCPRFISTGEFDKAMKRELKSDDSTAHVVRALVGGLRIPNPPAGLESASCIAMTNQHR